MKKGDRTEELIYLQLLPKGSDKAEIPSLELGRVVSDNVILFPDCRKCRSIVSVLQHTWSLDATI